MRSWKLRWNHSKRQAHNRVFDINRLTPELTPILPPFSLEQPARCLPIEGETFTSERRSRDDRPIHYECCALSYATSTPYRVSNNEEWRSDVLIMQSCCSPLWENDFGPIWARLSLSIPVWLWAFYDPFPLQFTYSGTLTDSICC